MIMNKDLPKIMFRCRHRNKVKVIFLHLQFVNIAKTLMIIWIMSVFPYFSRLNCDRNIVDLSCKTQLTLLCNWKNTTNNISKLSSTWLDRYDLKKKINIHFLWFRGNFILHHPLLLKLWWLKEKGQIIYCCLKLTTGNILIPFFSFEWLTTC